MNLFARKTIALRILTLALAIALTFGSAMAETVLAPQNLKVYQLPSTSSASMSVPAGTVMELAAQKDGWMKVQRSGKTAYVRAEDVLEVTDCKQASGYVKEAAPMYKAWGKSAKHGTLSVGTEVTVYAVAGEWAYVQYAGYKGFVKKDALSTKKVAADVPAQDENTAENEVVITKDTSAYAAVENAKVYKSYSTSSKVLGYLPVNTKLSIGAVCNGWAFVGLNGFYGFMKLDDLSGKKVAEAPQPTTSPSEDAADTGNKVVTTVPESADDGVSTTAPARGKAKAMDWWESDIQEIFARGTTATITDVATGIAWKEMRKGGTNHADVQPLTADDTAAMKAAVGSWSWNRRAIFVTINGVNYAASMNCMPHGSGSITNNNFDGHHCIHFTNSRGHSSNKVCELHQAAIQKALKATL